MVRVPVLKIILLALSVLSIALAGQFEQTSAKLAGVAGGLAFGILVARLDQRGGVQLLPTGAYRLDSIMGKVFACVCLLMIGTTTEIFVPYFLQTIHGYTPLLAGYMTAAMAGGWSIASLLSSGRADGEADRMVRLGPLLMTVSLAALAILLPLQDGMPLVLHSVLLAIALAGVGLGVGLGWPHLLTRVMNAAIAGEENLAASAITTVQLYAMAIGAALAGLVANASGLSTPGGVAGARMAALSLFGVFAVAPVLAILLTRKITRS